MEGPLKNCHCSRLTRRRKVRTAEKFESSMGWGCILRRAGRWDGRRRAGTVCFGVLPVGVAAKLTKDCDATYSLRQHWLLF